MLYHPHGADDKDDPRPHLGLTEAVPTGRDAVATGDRRQEHVCRVQTRIRE